MSAVAVLFDMFCMGLGTGLLASAWGWKAGLGLCLLTIYLKQRGAA